MKNLNIGSFTTMIYGWENWDIIDLSQWAKNNGFYFNNVDITKKLPKIDNNIELINCSHILEHLTREEGLSFLKECHRIMRPSGIIRIAIPDARTICRDYLCLENKDIMDYKHFNIGVEKAKDRAQALWEILFVGHKTIFDFQSLKEILEVAGFSEIKQMEFLKSQNPIIEQEIIDMYPTISLYVEATKPDQPKGPIITTGPITTRPARPAIETTIEKGKLKEKLRIALISTPFFGVPPKKYGGLEQIVWDLAEALDELGHKVIIFAPEDSKATNNGQLVVTGPSIETVGIDWFEEEKKRYNVYKDIINPEKFDLVHDNTWYAFTYLLKQKYPNLNVIHTHHGHMSWETAPPFPKPNLVAISDFMKKSMIQYFNQKGYNIDCQYVRNSVDIQKYIFHSKKTDRLLFVGRLSVFKQPHISVEVARKTNHKLDIVGSTFADSHEYINQLEKLIYGDPNISIFKDVDNDVKIEKMQNAKALIFPSQMQEPAGLVSIEAMSCGTPVIAFNDGAISEYVIHGKTGYICNNVQDMIDAVNKIEMIRPEDCRKHVEDNFSRLKMAEEYIKLYQRILDNNEW